MMELPLGDAPGVGRPPSPQPAQPAPAPAESVRNPAEPAQSAPSTGAPFVAPAPAAAPAPAQAARPISPAGSGAPQAPVSVSPAPRPIAPKEYYSISEVCDLVGLKPHVLRYWESQFPVLNPSKNRSGNRVYQRKEIKLVLLVQHLLYKEKYTIEGARQRLDQLRRGGKGGELPQATSSAVSVEMRKLLRDELTQLLEVLSPREPDGGGAAPPADEAPGTPRPGRAAE